LAEAEIFHFFRILTPALAATIHFIWCRGVLLLQSVSVQVMVLNEAQGQNCRSYSSLNTLHLFNSEA
jgi:hypothetical protein